MKVIYTDVSDADAIKIIGAVSRDHHARVAAQIRARTGQLGRQLFGGSESREIICV